HQGDYPQRRDPLRRVRRRRQGRAGAQPPPQDAHGADPGRAGHRHHALFGRAGGGKDAVTVLIDRSGHGGTSPGPDMLRLRLTPDGQLRVNTGDEEGFVRPGPDDITAGVVALPRFDFQEDIEALDAPTWFGEIRIPLEDLAPFKPGDALRLAVVEEGTFYAGAVPELPF